ncbi:hypothetical protein OJ997_18280 [Solirubrobacter phytolaccae]|uniref:Uncharacterized protein n=1 Tax=Solirubrobacter phytolaccae TaxID=1404360 RepID=A0A9X3N946_9ACTN|nr:hypothetical protein [Solirubrobacter phytolaccae]MDA0182260.1 hypothetical protein [Solirubrobacter phytolaccae]
MTPGLTISAREVDAIDLLDALGDDARRATWTLDRWVEATGCEHAKRLHELSEREATVPADELWPLLDGTQLIGGRIVGDLGDGAPWVMIESIRGDAWDVRSSDREVLARIVARYPGATPLPD